MALFIQIKYLNLVSAKLPLFKWKKPGKLANFRCPFCGDSQKNKRKARGYIYTMGNDMFYKCHNCPESTNFSNFLKFVEPNLHLEYLRETFLNERPVDPLPRKIEKAIAKVEASYPQIDKLKFCSRLTQLPEDHFARVYLESRKIPFEHVKRLFFTENLQLFIRENIDKNYPECTKDSAIVIPICDVRGHLVGVNCRLLKPENTFAKYIKAKINEDVKLIYGIERLRTDSKIHVFEGEFNSMFVPNSVAVGGIGIMSGIEKVLGVNKDNVVLVVDNDPRNPEVVKALTRLVEEDYSVVVLPGNVVSEDVNDMIVKDKYSIQEVLQTLEENTCRGLTAKLRVSEWKKCKV